MYKILTDIIEYNITNELSTDKIESCISAKYPNFVHWAISSAINDRVSIVVNYII